jgi:hypothetical protein
MGQRLRRTPKIGHSVETNQLAPFAARKSSEGRFWCHNVSIIISTALGLWHALFGNSADMLEERED